MFKMNLKKINAVFSAVILLSSSLSGAEYTDNDLKVAKSVSAKSDTSSGGQPSTTDITSGDKATDINEAEAGALDAEKGNIDKYYGQMQAMTVSINDIGFSKVTEGYQKYTNNWNKCATTQKVAAYACLSNLSSKIQDGAAAINVLAAAASASSVNDACSTFGKAMTVAQAALTAYTAGCGAAKGSCNWFCSSVKTGLDTMKPALANSQKATCKSGFPTCDLASYYKLAKSMSEAVDKDNDSKDIKAAAGKNQVCSSKYATLLASAAAGIYGVVNAIKQGKSCDEDTTADGSTSTATTETCAIEANANLPECICLKNPMLEGCGSVAAKSSMSSTGSGLSALSATGSSTGTDGLTSADLATGSTSSTATRDPSSSSGSTGIGAPTGGGASLGGSGGGSGATSGADDKSGHKALDTNILGGSSGGGGGGGMWGGGGDSSDKSGYRSYLPGGSKDPTKMMGGQGNASKEVTGQGGKSNWEKVRDRYQDNKSSLLNN